MDEQDKDFNIIACRSCRTKPCRYFLWHREANPILVLSEDIGKPDCIFVANKLLGKFELSSIPKHTIEQNIANFRSETRLNPFQTYSWKSPDMDAENGNRQEFLRFVEGGDIKIIRPPISQKQFERFKKWFEESEKLKQYTWLPPASEIDFKDFVEEASFEKPDVAKKTVIPKAATLTQKIKFKNIDDATKEALEKFYKGEIGSSIRNISIENKTFRQIDNEIAGSGGWIKDPKTGKLMSADGQWIKTEKITTKDPLTGQPCTPHRMIFYENKDGGVIRLKPDGKPDSRYPHMKIPHGCKYVKKDPNGGTGVDNEAFKVNGGNAIPSLPHQIDFPPGIQPNTPESEDYMTYWRFVSHQPLKIEN